ncbi:hypothetical protein RHMOL_Rhmol07G0080800 [Rhododendron molle]|uniref:Uncharacterized protein n=1 Tax=Rhododendron molle TaxID=49168 RepID=A0ACC0MZH3_RHOML|nr:hypothetical protein RHMOL_Rhmol07G0080800 [Rhododendron molle]
MRRAMIPTGKNRSIIGGGGSGGRNGGSTSIDAVRTTSTSTHPRLKHLISNCIVIVVSSRLAPSDP